MRPADVTALLSGFIAKAAVSDLPFAEKAAVIDRLTGTYLSAVATVDLQVHVEEIEDILNNRDRKE